LLCSGRVYYDLTAERTRRKDTRTAILRLEQLYPLDLDAVRAELEPFGDADLVWVQDEPANQGPWTFISDHLGEALGGRSLRRVSRPAAASPAAGSGKRHKEEAGELMESAFGR
ncbi:2-oxoglutarate dehydrogenase E1 component, partial [Georgenia sp. 10Sc9-8]|nr:2-oxoglutarate dehydrogenase E1 component [Georgenia halotolerans]